MNIINAGMMNSNALSQSKSTALKILQSKINTVSKENRTNNNKRKFVDGHRVIPSDKQKVNKQLMRVCKDFESIFVNQLFKVMRSTLNKKNNILHGGRGEEVFEDMLYQNYSKEAAESGDFGFGKLLYEHLNSINRGY